MFSTSATLVQHLMLLINKPAKNERRHAETASKKSNSILF